MTDQKLEDLSSPTIPEGSNGAGDGVAPQKPSEYTASIYSDGALPAGLVDGLKRLQAAFGCPAWLVIQQVVIDPRDYNGPDTISDMVKLGFFRERHQLAQCERPLLVVDSPGGFADNAYEIAQLFRRHSGGFRAVVPRFAKSAATLLTLGADEIYMGVDAQIGPLDAQIPDYEREKTTSALNEVQALERLHIEAMDQVDRTMYMLQIRTKKKMSTLLPIALDFVNSMMKPMLEKIDTVHYSEQARILKVGEDYAVRLLTPRYGLETANKIARHLVNEYPEHGFVISREETHELLGLSTPTPDQAAAIEALEEWLTENQVNAVGRLQEVTADGQNQAEDA